MFWDLTNYTSTGVAFNPGVSSMVSMEFTTDGLKLYCLSGGTGVISQYSLTTPFSIATCSPDGITFTATVDANSLTLSEDGTILTVMESGTSVGYQYELSTPFLISSASLLRSGSVFGESGTSTDYKFTTDGLTAYRLVIGWVEQFSLTTPYNISTATYIDRGALTGSNHVALAVSPNGRVVFVLENNDGRLRQYNLSTSFDITTITYSGIAKIPTYEWSPSSLYVTPDGRLCINGDKVDSRYIYENTLFTEPTMAIQSVWKRSDGKVITYDGTDYVLMDDAENPTEVLSKNVLTAKADVPPKDGNWTNGVVVAWESQWTDVDNNLRALYWAYLQALANGTDNLWQLYVQDPGCKIKELGTYSTAYTPDAEAYAKLIAYWETGTCGTPAAE